MKYGLITYSELPKGRKGGEKGLFNVGDNIQMAAMKRIYRDVMGIPLDEIVMIDYHDLATYDGEYVVVPINLWFPGCRDPKEQYFPTSPKIIPVFIGVHFSSNHLSSEEVSYLHTYAPIGCRDEYTLQTMQKYHIPAYLFGCVTSTLPKRNNVSIKKPGFTYIVDVDSDVLQYIPYELKNQIRYKFHQPELVYSKDVFNKMDEMAISLLTEYYNDAALVITSRLHCASPCVAMGIPTVLIVKECSSRFSWFEKFIPIYTPDEYEYINWYPDLVDNDDIKEQMVQTIVKRLTQTKEKYETLFNISEYYEKRVKKEYVNPNQKILQSIDRVFKSGDFNSYILIGSTTLSEDIYQHICETYPYLHLVGFIDEFNSVDFHGVSSTDISVLLESGNIPVIVTPSAKDIIKNKIENIGYNGICIFHDGDVYSPK